MDLLSAVAAALLATVFAVSGAAKLLDRSGTRQAVEALGVPLPIAGAVTAVLPVVELLLAVLLLPPMTGRLAAVGAVLLLVLFTAVVVGNLRAGRRPRCGCFGGLGSSDVSWRTVARNGVLILTGLVAAGERAWTPTAGMLGIAGAAAVIGGEQWLSRRAEANSEQAQADAFDRALDAETDAEKEPAPDFTLPDLTGARVRRDDLLLLGRPVLLVVLNPDCGSCRRLVPDLVRWHEAYEDSLTVVAVGRGSAEAVRSGLGETGPLTVLLSNDDELAGYGTTPSPSAALLRPDGRLAAPAALGSIGVRRLLAVALDVATDAIDGSDPSELDLTARPAPRRTVTVQDREEGTVLLDEATGASLALDPLGTLVWQTLDGSSTLDEIVTDLAEVFSAPREVVAHDVLQLVRTCGEAGLLAGVRAQEWTPA